VLAHSKEGAFTVRQQRAATFLWCSLWNGQLWWSMQIKALGEQSTAIAVHCSSAADDRPSLSVLLAAKSGAACGVGGDSLGDERTNRTPRTLIPVGLHSIDKVCRNSPPARFLFVVLLLLARIIGPKSLVVVGLSSHRIVTSFHHNKIFFFLVYIVRLGYVDKRNQPKHLVEPFRKIWIEPLPLESAGDDDAAPSTR